MSFASPSLALLKISGLERQARLVEILQGNWSLKPGQLLDRLVEEFGSDKDVAALITLETKRVELLLDSKLPKVWHRLQDQERRNFLTMALSNPQLSVDDALDCLNEETQTRTSPNEMQRVIKVAEPLIEQEICRAVTAELLLKQLAEENPDLDANTLRLNIENRTIDITPEQQMLLMNHYEQIEKTVAD